MKSRMFWRLAPVPCRTAELSSFSAQMSPAAGSNPPTLGSSIRCRARTPAPYHVRLESEATHAVHAGTLMSFIAWKFGPSARIKPAWTGPRGFVLSPAIGGIEK